MIPLFPLNLVLCPEENLALHIFEERYKEMINLCLSEDRPFGVVLVDDNQLKTFGCTAGIVEVKKRYEDGKLDIQTTGYQRFELLSIDRRKSYLQGTVNYFDDYSEQIDLVLRENVINLHLELLDLAKAPENITDYESHRVSFHIAHSAGLELNHKQLLLEMKSENERLKYLFGHFRELIGKIRYFEDIKSLIRSNGHIKQFPPLDINIIGGIDED